MAKTKIEWADVVWNPVRGCTRVSEEQLEKPLHWSKPRRIFVNSMSDLFHEDLSFEDISRVFSVMKIEQRHQYLILTKRPDRMRQFIHRLVNCVHWKDGLEVFHQSFSHVWLGVSVEDQKTADERIPILLDTPAAIRFVSAEPLLGSVNLCNIGSRYHDALKGQRWEEGRLCSTPKLDWVICGGESGPGARPMHPAWAREIRDDCQEAGVPFHFKQHGDWSHDCTGYPDAKVGFVTPDGRWQASQPAGYGADFPGALDIYRVGKKNAGRLLDGREWKEFPR